VQAKVFCFEVLKKHQATMRKAFIAQLSLLFCCSMLLAQRQQPGGPFPVRSSQYYQGFETIVSGEKLDYPPILQKGKYALMATPGGKEIAFQTQALPSAKDEKITFIWQASIAKATGERPAVFDFFINGEKKFSFASPKNDSDKDWAYQQGGTELAFLSTTPADENGNYTGYQFLTLPKKDLQQGKPLTIKVLPENAILPGAYTAYQNVVQSSLQCFPMQALKKQDGKRVQPLLLEFNHVGPPVQSAVFLDGKKQFEWPLQLGLNTINIWVDQVEKERPAQVQLVFQNKEKSKWEQELRLKPVRPFEVYFLPHSHVDVGFTHLQDEVEKMQWRNFEQGIELAKKTANYPERARYKWNVEVLWAVDGYLKNASQENRDAFIEAVKKGWIGLDALYGSELTGLQRPEELMHVTSFANQLEREYGIGIHSAMITDVPGYAWGIVPALAQSEVKYFSIGPNHMPHKAHGGYQVGLTFEAWGDIPFWWESPSGKEKVLFWMTRHGYSWFHDWLLGKLRRTNGVPVVKFLGELDSDNYPYDIVQIRYTLGDNGGPDTDMPEFVKEWNEQYEYPKFRIATTTEMFRDFEAKYGAQLPTHRGDFTPYWEDGAASSALETAMNRNTAERLVQAEVLWSIFGRQYFPAKQFDEAWTNVLLFSEHTWGAVTSKSDPDIDFTKKQWEVKKSFAEKAAQQADLLVYQGLSGLNGPKAPMPPFLVFNTNSWERTDLVKVPAEWNAGGYTVFEENGQAVPTQTLSTGEVAFLAEKLAPFSAKKYFLKKNGTSSPVGQAVKVNGFSLSNEWISASLHEADGTFASLRHQGIPFDFVEKDSFGFNEYWYTGVDAENPRKSFDQKIKIKENGPLVASLVVESEAPGARRFTREIQLVAGLGRLDILNTIDKKRVLEDENVRFSFPFHVPDGQVRMDLAWALMQPEKDQLKGANKNFFCPQHFVDISNEKAGITWANLDAPILETGEMHGQRWMSDLLNEPWLKTWIPSTRLFSWVMNNVWFVNYKRDQEGIVSFRYSLQPHRVFDSAEAKKFGIERSQPLLLTMTDEAQKSIPSFLNLEGDESIIVTSMRPLRDGKGLLLRFFNTTEKTAKTRLKWAWEKPLALHLSNQKEKRLIPLALDAALEFGPWEIQTVRVDFE
jgi:hypothetical protein